MEYTILILLLPLLSFLLLGIGGKWITHRTAGFIGTAVLGVVAVLSYVTAVQYFSAPRLEDGTFATWIPYNFEWLAFHRNTDIQYRNSIRPYFGDDVNCHLHCVADGTHLLFRLHERRKRLSALLCFPEPFHNVDARVGGSHQHFPDVSILGIGGCIVLFAHRISIIPNRQPSQPVKKHLS